MTGGAPSALGVVVLAGTIALAACGGSDGERPGPAPYAAPSYTDSAGTSVTTALRFTEITREAGIAFQHVTGAFGRKWMPETMGSGGGFLDYDGDGWVDIVLVNGRYWPGHESPGPPPTPRLYRNRGNGRFEDVTARAGLDFSIYGMGVAIADYDADGDPDIYVTALGDNRLLRNDGGRFVDVTAEAGVSGNGERPGSPPAWSTAAAWVDVDRDGWLDLFVCNYVQWTPETDLFTTLDGVNKSYATPQQYQGESCRLYRNRGDGTFADVTAAAGVLNHDGKSLGVAVEDFNDDGWPDLVVANDTQRNFLYLNNRDGTFLDVAVAAGVGFDEFGRARAGMGIDVGDVSGDGRLAIAIGNFSREPVSLYTQIGEGLFQDRAGSARLSRATLLPLTFGVLFADLDLDGRLDLMLANGHIEPEIHRVQQDVAFRQPLQLFVNDGRGRFVEVGAQGGSIFRDSLVGRGLAVGDVDRDGDWDVLVTENGGPARLLRNDLPPAARRVVELWLKGRHPNLDAVGAVVTAYAGDVVQRRMVRTGSSYLSQSQLLPVRIGLGTSAHLDSVSVRWPRTGRRDIVRGVGPGAYEWREGSGRLVPIGRLP